MRDCEGGGGLCLCGGDLSVASDMGDSCFVHFFTVAINSFAYILSCNPPPPKAITKCQEIIPIIIEEDIILPNQQNQYQAHDPTRLSSTINPIYHVIQNHPTRLPRHPPLPRVRPFKSIIVVSMAAGETRLG